MHAKACVSNRVQVGFFRLDKMFDSASLSVQLARGEGGLESYGPVVAKLRERWPLDDAGETFNFYYLKLLITLHNCSDLVIFKKYFISDDAHTICFIFFMFIFM